MQLPQNIVTFLQGLPLKKMRGEDVFVAVAFFLSKGQLKAEIETKEVNTNWRKGVIGKKYNSGYFTKAKGRVHPTQPGKFTLTEEGVSYIEDLIGHASSHQTSLLVYKSGTTHSFDKFLRGVLKNAKQSVDIADTYVAGNLFDVLLDEIPKSIPVQFVFGNDVGGFVARSKRFAKQYKLSLKANNQFHDRFLLVDGKGYISGPSLKDAADKKPATLIVLNRADSTKLADLFDEIWLNGRIV